jgi:hypothetical protein
MASGRPIVATAVNGVVDVIAHGSTGLLAPPADPEALARNVVWLLEHPEAAARMGDAARERAKTLFDPALMCALIEQTYTRLLGLPSAAPSTRVRHVLADVKASALGCQDQPGPASLVSAAPHDDAVV